MDINEKNNNGNDINVSSIGNNIEEAIKIMEHWVEYEKNNKEKINRADELINIQETILLNYKRALKENEELKRKNKTLEELLQGNLYELYKYYKELAGTYQGNCISKEKIKNKIEYLKDYIEENSDEQGYWGNINSDIIYGKIEILEESLEESED